MTDENIIAARWLEREKRVVDLLEPALRVGLYVSSLASLVYAVVFGLVLLVQCKVAANKRVGTICLILAAVHTVLVAALVVVYVAFIIFIIAAAAAKGGAGAAAGG